MTYIYLFLFVLVISTINSIKHVSTLNSEGIVNGRLANQSNFQYQAAIFMREDKHSMSELCCNGVIVAPSWILSVAHCFMLNSEKLIENIFTAIVGSSDITISDGYFEDIVLIYTYDYDANDHYNDITMAKLENALPLHTKLNRITIPNLNESFLFRKGLVSGYGWYNVTHYIDEDENIFYLDNMPELKLRYTYVKILSSSECTNESLFRTKDKKFCGLTQHVNQKYTGVCVKDIGSPLVIENKVVGLVVTNHDNCDDTEHGSLYIEVSHYSHFIQNIIQNVSMESVVMHSFV